MREETVLLTADEVATLLRTTKDAIYNMVSRAKLPGVVKVGRRTLFNKKALYEHLGI